VTPEQVGRMAAAAGVKAVVLTHLSPTANPKDDYQRYAAGTKKFYCAHQLAPAKAGAPFTASDSSNGVPAFAGTASAKRSCAPCARASRCPTPFAPCPR
jgi:hypothetical protein